MKIISSELYVKDNKVYHEGNKPKPKDIGAAPETHTHNYASATTPGGSAEHAIKATEDSLGQRIDKYIKGLSVSGRTITYTRGDGTTGTITTQDNDTKVTNTLNTTAKAYITGTTNSATNTGTQVFDTNVYLDTTAGMLTATTFKGALQGNAATATSATSASHAAKLTTPRSINGTNFDGTAAITTANWGTARTLTIGNTGKSVNGSGNVSWSIGEIGAAPTVHNHTSLTGITNLSFAAEGTDSASITTTVEGPNTYFDFNLSDDPSQNDMWRWRFRPSGGNLFNAMTLDAISTTEAKLAVTGEVQATRLKGTLTGDVKGNVTGTVSGNAGSATKLATARTINGTNFDGTGNITTANWGTARNIQIGNAVKSVNGSGNVTWNWSEMQVPRAYSSSYSFGGNQNAITTAQFITMLTNLGAFSQPHWVSRGSWSYASNQYINDTGCGNIHLAGCVVEVFGNSSAYTIKVTTPTTSSSGVTNGDFIYVNNGSNYSPGWRRLYSTAYKPTASEIGAAASNHTHSYLPLSGGTMTGAITVSGESRFHNGTYTDPWHGTTCAIKASGHVAVNGQIKATSTITAPTFAGALSGNASTASTLATARTIGKASFNGSANITLAQIMGYATTATSGNGTYTNQWTRFATIDISSGAWVDCSGSFIFSSREADAFSGTLQFYFRNGNTVESTSISLRWTELTNSSYANCVAAVKVSNGKYDLYFKPIANYTMMGITALVQQVGYLTLHSHQSYSSSITAAATSSLSACANTANTLATARTINGTNFDGSANITTANWGTARNIQIGNTAKSVNGSGNVSWSLSEIGALALTGGTMTGTITSSKSTGTHLEGNRGTGAIINSTAAGSAYNMLVKMNSTNGAWTMGGWNNTFNLFYTTNSTITAGNNTYTKRLILLDENGNSSFPGTITGSLSGNASTATKLQTARSINGTSFDGSGNITTANWGTARSIQIGNTAKSVNGSANVTWTLGDIGAAAANHTHGLVNLNSEAFSGGNDLNTYNSIKTWVARTLNSTTNRPADYFTVVNFGASANSNFQLAHSYANSSTLYVRGRHDTSGNYTPWAKVYTDKNKPTASEIGAAASSSVGTLSSLKTSAKENLVAAINEVFQSGNNVKQNLVDTLIAKGAEDISTSNSWDSLIDMIEGSNINLAPASFTVEQLPNAQYEFVLLGSGYYESQNMNVHNSYAMCKLNIVCNRNYNVYLDCINHAENNYDYGIISQINTPLTFSYQADTTGVLKSFKGLSSPGVQSIQLKSESGFYYIKYVKDSTASQGNDSLRFKVRFEKKPGGNPGAPGNPGSEETILFGSTIGGDNSSLTGGYTHKRETSGSYFVYDDSGMDFMAHGTGRGGNTLETVISENRIELTNYSTLRIKGYFTTTTNDSGGAPLVGFDAIGNRDSAFAASTAITSSGQRYYDLDISGLTGSYHLKFNVATSLQKPSTGEIIKHLYITELILYP